jgi:hypothetical protein
MRNRLYEFFVQLDSRGAKTEKWPNATDIEEAFLALKTTLYYSIPSPNLIFGPLSDALVVLEQALAI